MISSSPLYGSASIDRLFILDSFRVWDLLRLKARQQPIGTSEICLYFNYYPIRGNLNISTPFINEYINILIWYQNLYIDLILLILRMNIIRKVKLNKIEILKIIICILN